MKKNELKAELREKERIIENQGIELQKRKAHLKLSDIKIDNDNLDYIKMIGEICGKLRDDLVKLFAISDISVSELDIDAMFPYEYIKTARPTRPENRIRAYNSRQADRREGAKRLLSKLNLL